MSSSMAARAQQWRADDLQQIEKRVERQQVDTRAELLRLARSPVRGKMRSA